MLGALRSSRELLTRQESASSTRLASNRTIDRAEPCFITNVSAYTHQQAHWINAIRGSDDKHADATVLVESFLGSQGIVDHIFRLDDASNLANVDAALHIAMDKYAMFAITCSHEFLDKYIAIITVENDRWLHEIEKGSMYIRKLKVLDPSVRYAEYELVVLQPNHFLPDESLLPVYSRQQGQVIGTPKHYKIAADRVLRELPGHETSQSFPPFRFIGNRNRLGHTINPYLVILAAEIKFRRYLAANGPQLHPVYNSLMEKTIQVAELLYFRPAEREYGTSGDPLVVDMEAYNSRVDLVDAEMGFRTSVDNESGDSTARQRRQNAGGGVGTRSMDAGYWRHMLSGSDLEQ